MYHTLHAYIPRLFLFTFTLFYPSYALPPPLVHLPNPPPPSLQVKLPPFTPSNLKYPGCKSRNT